MFIEKFLYNNELVFPEIRLPIIIAAGLSTFILMVLFSIISVWYPAQKASNTQPAIALKQEE